MTETIFLYSIYYFLGNELKLKNKKFKVISIIVTLLLIFISVIADLYLPSLMSDIINYGVILGDFMTDYISTYSKLKFRPLEPVADDIRIEDIAHSLSNNLYLFKISV